MMVASILKKNPAHFTSAANKIHLETHSLSLPMAEIVVISNEQAFNTRDEVDSEDFPFLLLLFRWVFFLFFCCV